MIRHTPRRLPVATVLAAVLAWTVIPSGPSQTRPPVANATLAEGLQVVFDPSATRASTFVPPPATLYESRASHFIVNFGPEFPVEGQAAFQRAVDIWAGVIRSNVPIVVKAEWTALTPASQCGTGEAMRWLADYPNAPVPGTMSAVAMANARADTDLDPGTADLVVRMNSRIVSGGIEIPWYFGTDGMGPSGDAWIDFVTCALHEVGHGLGFSGSARVTGGLGEIGASGGGSTMFDRFVVNDQQQSLLDRDLFPNPSTALANELQGGRLYFDSSGSSMAQLSAPPTFVEGSSYSHLDGARFPMRSANGLMGQWITNNAANHDPGPITLQILSDIGWPSRNWSAPPGLTSAGHALGENSATTVATREQTQFLGEATLGFLTNTCAKGFWHVQSLNETTRKYTVGPGIWRLTRWRLRTDPFSTSNPTALVAFVVLRQVNIDASGDPIYQVISTTGAFGLSRGLNTIADDVEVKGGDKIGFHVAFGTLEGCLVDTAGGDSVEWNFFDNGASQSIATLPVGAIINLRNTPSSGGTNNRRMNLEARVEEICRFTLSATSTVLFPAAGVTSTAVRVTSGSLVGGGALSSCGFDATSNAPWITNVRIEFEQGSNLEAKVVIYTVEPNTSTTPRTGTITIAGQTFTVNQAGTTTPTPTPDPTPTPTPGPPAPGGPVLQAILFPDTSSASWVIRLDLTGGVAPYTLEYTRSQGGATEGTFPMGGPPRWESFVNCQLQPGAALHTSLGGQWWVRVRDGSGRVSNQLAVRTPTQLHPSCAQ